MKISYLVVAGFVMGVASMAAQSESDDKEKPLAQQLVALKRLRLETAQELHRQFRAAFEAETVSLEQLLAVMRQLIDAERAVAASPQVELNVLKEGVQRLKQLFAKLCPPGYPPKHVMGERHEYPILQVEIQTAEIAVVEFRLSNKL